MSIQNRVALAAVFLLLSSAALGDGINNPKSGSGGNTIGFIEGINNLGGGGGGGGSSCSGALDLSQGCIIPGIGP